MKSILIEDFLARNVDAPQGQIQFKGKDGEWHSGWAIVKPLNYDKEFLSDEDRKQMAQEVLYGHAIAVHFTEDELAIGEMPTLYKRHLEQVEAGKRVVEHVGEMCEKIKGESVPGSVSGGNNENNEEGNAKLV